MLEVINKVDTFISALQRVNDRIIYFCDIIVSIHVHEKKKTKKGDDYIQDSYRQVVLIGECYECKPLESGKKFFYNQLKHKLELKKTKTKTENIDIIKIILTKELGCSIYKD